MPAKPKSKPKGRSKVRKKRKRKRPYKRDKAAHVRRRVQNSAPHRRAMRQQTESLNYLLHQLLKTASSTEDKPYNYEPRHYSKDPEYVYSNPAMQEFKRGFPAPDTHHWRPQGPNMPPYRDNY